MNLFVKIILQLILINVDFMLFEYQLGSGDNVLWYRKTLVLAWRPKIRTTHGHLFSWRFPWDDVISTILIVWSLEMRNYVCMLTLKRKIQGLKPGQTAKPAPKLGLNPPKWMLCIWWVVKKEKRPENTTLNAYRYRAQLNKLDTLITGFQWQNMLSA